MKGGNYNNQVFKQLQEVMKKCDDLSKELKEVKKQHAIEIYELKKKHKKEVNKLNAKIDAFSGAANNVESIIFPEKTTTIESRVFVYCAKLKVLNLGKNVSDINPDFRTNTNMDITLNIDEENPYYVVKDKVLYNKNEYKLLAVLYKINGTYTVPDNIKIIGSSAFKNQDNMTIIGVKNKNFIIHSILFA